MQGSVAVANDVCLLEQLQDRSPYIFNKDPDGERSVTIELFHLPDADGAGAVTVHDRGVQTFGKCTVRSESGPKSAT